MRAGWGFLDTFVLGIQVIPSEGIGLCIGWLDFWVSWGDRSPEEVAEEAME